MNERPVLIVGAGPTGLTAAMELSRFGIPVRIVDKLSKFADTSRALAVQARTVELFQQRGLADEMLRLGNKGHATTIYADAKMLGRLDLSQIDSPFNYILLLAQSETERILREQVVRQGVVIETGTELVAIGQAEGEQAITAVLAKADGAREEVEAAYVIASDGAHSVLRHTLQLAYPGKSLPHSYALADLHAESSLPEDELSIFLSERNLLAIFPMGGHRFRLIATEAEEAKDAPDPDLAKMQRLYDAGSHLPARLYDMIWSSHFRINSRMLKHLRVGSIFFGGDAAHIHSPAGGQGMNTGIQDMINLCWKLALVHKDIAPSSLLDTYETERLPVISKLLETTEGATDAFTADNRLLHEVITLAAPAALHLGPVQKQAAKVLSQIGTSYAQSPLTQDAGSFGEVHAGERFPVRSGQQPLDPSRFTVLVSGSRAAELSGALTGWKDILAVRSDFLSTHSENRIVSGNQIVLIRPDGYVALITRDGQELVAWFQKWTSVMQA